MNIMPFISAAIFLAVLVAAILIYRHLRCEADATDGAQGINEWGRPETRTSDQKDYIGTVE